MSRSRFSGYFHLQVFEFIFIVYDKDSWVSQRFVLSEEKSEEFAKFIDGINQYMLEHGELWIEEK